MNTSHIRNILSAIAIALTATAAQAQGNLAINFHNEATDTTRINNILQETIDSHLPSANARVAFIARKFIDTPYVAHTLEGTPETLTVNLDELDCTTFVETVAALAETAGENRSSWRDFVYNLRNMRYRHGSVDGYASRLHYICDWAMSNVSSGRITDAARSFPIVNYVIKTISFMTDHRDRYPALADDTEYERIRNVEIGYVNHRFPYIKTIDLNKKPTKQAFRDGDIVALTTNLKDLDVTHMGIIMKDADGEPHLLHASSSLGKVTVTTEPLWQFMKRNRSLTGMRVFRLAEM